MESLLGSGILQQNLLGVKAHSDAPHPAPGPSSSVQHPIGGPRCGVQRQPIPDLSGHRPKETTLIIWRSMQCKGHFLSWVWNTILFLLLLDYPSNSTCHKWIPKCASGRADSRVHSVTLCWSRTRNTLRRRIPDRGLEFEGILTLQTLFKTAVLKPGETKPLLLGLQPWIISIVILSTKAIRVPYVSRNCLPKVRSQLYVITICQKMDTPPLRCPPPRAKSSLAVSRPEGALAIISWNSFISQRERRGSANTWLSPDSGLRLSAEFAPPCLPSHTDSGFH